MAKQRKRKGRGPGPPNRRPGYEPPPERRPVGQRAGHRKWQPRFFSCPFDVWLPTVKPTQPNLFGIVETLWDQLPEVFHVEPEADPSTGGSFVRYHAKVSSEAQADQIEVRALRALGREFALPSTDGQLPDDIEFVNFADVRAIAPAFDIRNATLEYVDAVRTDPQPGWPPPFPTYDDADDYGDSDSDGEY